MKNIDKIIKESLNKVLLKEAMKFNFSFTKLEQMTSFKQRLEYCKEMLGVPIGRGSSRLVFQIDDEKCLKLAMNRKGLAQNEVEAQNGNDYYIQSLIPKYYGELSDNENYTYIVTEYVIPVKESDFEWLIGVDYYTFQHLIRQEVNSKNGLRGWKGLDADEINLVYESDDNTMAEIIDYCVNYNVNPIEITDPRNLGMTKRDGNVILVLLDNGFNDDIANQYYSRKKGR